MKKFLLTIKKIGINGEGIGYYKKKITFVHGALPEEEVICKVLEETDKYIKAKLLTIKKKSPFRRENIKKEFLDSGAYNLIHVEYKKQLEYKKNIVCDSFSKYLGTKYLDKIENTIACEKEFHYRNKCQFPFSIDKSGHVIAGLYKEGTNELVNIKNCPVQHENINKVVEIVKKYIAKYKVPISISKNFVGIKYLVCRASFASGDVQIAFVTNSKEIPSLKKVVHELKKESFIKSIVLNIKEKNSHLVMGKENILLYGEENIIEKIGDVKYKLSANSFFQLNPIQTKNLYDKVIELANIKNTDIILDAFCGVGSIGIYLSKYAGEVYGVDIEEENIKNANDNIKLNNIKNCVYKLSDAKESIKKYKKDNIKFDIVIVDPPRVGLKFMANELLKIKAKKIVYVSCNPSTLAKDMKILTKKYKIKTIIPVDMFPQTASVESICLMIRK